MNEIKHRKKASQTTENNERSSSNHNGFIELNDEGLNAALIFHGVEVSTGQGLKDGPFFHVRLFRKKHRIYT